MASLRPITLLAVSLFGIALLLAACTRGGSSESLVDNPFYSPCRFSAGQEVEVNGNTYSPLWGPMRSDILRTDAFSKTDLVAVDTRECKSSVPSSIHEIAGVPVEQIFVEFRHTKNMNGANHSFPLACHFVNEVYTFTAIDAEESPPPFSRPTSVPWSEGSPTPVPTAPTDGPFVELSSEGLLAAGWPYFELFAPNGNKVYWDSGIKVRYNGRAYRFSSSMTLNGDGNFEVPLDETDQINIIFPRYSEDRWPEGLAKAFPHLLTDGQVEDRVRLLRPLDRSHDDVIIIDPCPTYPNNLQPENVVFWGRIQPPEPAE